MSLFLQPVQDLTIDSTVSRSSYQFVVEGARSVDLRTWLPRLIDKLSVLPELENVSTNFLDDGLSAYVAIDRDTGKVLWESILSGPIQVSTITYAVNGKQYVAVLTGDGGPGTAIPLQIVGDIKPARNHNSVFVFALP